MSRSGIVRSQLLVLVIAGTLVMAAGCGKKPKPSTEVTKPAPVVEQPVKPVEPTPSTEKPAAEMVLADVFFDYDKANLREDARLTLEGNARMLMQHPEVKLLLEGHCDERGTVEYNLALGDRRAQSVKVFLVEFGVDAGRLTTISYGEERPFAQGHDENTWSQNRRAHFVVQR
jgi:peptidoglycan-associated lipoprotein